MELRINELHGFRNHPFQVKDDAAMDALCESIAQYGVLSPLLARPVEHGYEIISGHRRRQRRSGWVWTSSPCWCGT